MVKKERKLSKAAPKIRWPMMYGAVNESKPRKPFGRGSSMSSSSPGSCWKTIEPIASPLIY